MCHTHSVLVAALLFAAPLVQADEEPIGLKREQQMTYAPLAVALSLGSLTITEHQFHEAARRAFSRRHWKVLDAKGNVVTAELVRKGAIYRGDMENKGSSVEIRYQPTYSDKRTNYLDNLRRDLAFELRISD